MILNPGRPRTRHHHPEHRVAARHRGRRRPLRSQLSQHPAVQFVFTVSLLHDRRQTAQVTRRTAAISHDRALPTSLTAADLTGNGLDDLIAANALDNSVTIALQTAPVAFRRADHGAAPASHRRPSRSPTSTATVCPTSSCTDQASGDVTVLLNDPERTTSTSLLRFRAEPELSRLGTTSSGPTVARSPQSVSLVAGDFTGRRSPERSRGGRSSGTHSFTLLAADGNGGFAQSAALASTTSTSDGGAINDAPGRDRGGRLQPRRHAPTSPC